MKKNEDRGGCLLAFAVVIFILLTLAMQDQLLDAVGHKFIGK